MENYKKAYNFITNLFSEKDFTFILSKNYLEEQKIKDEVNANLTILLQNNNIEWVDSPYFIDENLNTKQTKYYKISLNKDECSFNANDKLYIHSIAVTPQMMGNDGTLTRGILVRILNSSQDLTLIGALVSKSIMDKFIYPS